MPFTPRRFWGWADSRARAPRAQISRHRSQLALADGAACGAGDAPGATPSAKKGRGATPSVGLYRSLWVSLLLTCNPALQARAAAQHTRHVSTGP